MIGESVGCKGMGEGGVELKGKGFMGGLRLLSFISFTLVGVMFRVGLELRGLESLK